jgi:hypothetical protein
MRTSKSITMETAQWMEIGTLADSEFSGDVSTAIETLCMEALKQRGD